jgi:hypothetical protein
LNFLQGLEVTGRRSRRDPAPRPTAGAWYVA